MFKASILPIMAAFLIAAPPGAVMAQDSTTSNATPAAPANPVSAPPSVANGSISGKVVDREGTPLSDVLVSISANGLGGSLVTQASGRYRFDKLPGGTTFNVGFAKKDYLMETKTITVNPGYEIVLNIVLRKTKVKALKPITVVAAPAKGSRAALKYLGGDEISNAKVPNILQAINRLRPSMLVKHTSIGMCIDSVFSLYVDGIRRPVFDPEYSEFDSTQARMRAVPLSQIAFERELEAIQPKEIAQITYISCDDYVPGIPRRNVIWVVTKRALAGAAAVRELEETISEEMQQAEQERQKEEEEKKQNQ